MWFIAGDSGKAYLQIAPFERAAKEDGIKYAFVEWSAKLPETEQDKLANDLFTKLVMPSGDTIQYKAYEGYDVYFFLPWNRPHSGDYNLDDLFAWIENSMK